MRQAKIGCSFAYARQKKHHMEPGLRQSRRCTVGHFDFVPIEPRCRCGSGWHHIAEGSRRSPALWRVGKITGGYLVRDANGQALTYLYSRDNEVEVRRARMLTKDEAVAINLGEQGFRHQLYSH
jgi:hypothetical protein